MKTDVYEKQTSTTSRQRGGERSGSSKSDLDKEEMMRQMKVAGTPGPAHQALAELVGNWKAEVKCWMDPGGDPNVSNATSKTSLILDGRFLQEEFHGEMMGQPFVGKLLLGFDNTKQKFNSVWVDSLNTAMYTSEGKGDSGHKTITLEGKMDCPGTGRKDVPMKQIFRVLSRDKHVLEMFNDGVKSMEIIYTRQ